MSGKIHSPVVVSVHPSGLCRRGLHRWPTKPMTQELADELVRVRTRLEAEIYRSDESNRGGIGAERPRAHSNIRGLAR